MSRLSRRLFTSPDRVQNSAVKTPARRGVAGRREATPGYPSTAQRTRISSPGFTLIELLVVIAIIGILVSFLLPAVQKAREVGRQAACQDNLKQIGIAFNTHANEYGWYPTGGWGSSWSGDYQRGYGKKQPGGWYYNILAFTESASIRKMATPSNVGMPSFICPTRRGVPAAAYSDYAANGGTTAETWPPTSAYAANQYGPGFQIGGGPSSEAIGDSLPSLSAAGGPSNWSGIPCPPSGWPPNDPSIPWPPPAIVAPTLNNPGSGPAAPPNPPLPEIGNLCWPDWATGANPSVAIANGITFLRSQIRPKDVTDGVSKTIMLGEKSMAVGGLSDSSAYIGHASYTIRWESTAPVPDQNTNSSAYGSGHPAIAYFVFCDGSVHSILFSIDMATFKALGGRNDRLTIISNDID